jgi:hypothetical protein
MLKNANYNLLEEIVQLSKSLHRYDRYLDDARADPMGCSECMQIWTQLKMRHEEDLTALLAQMQHHIESGIFDLGLAESPMMRP